MIKENEAQRTLDICLETIGYNVLFSTGCMNLDYFDISKCAMDS